MAVNVRGESPDQMMLLPPSVREWLPENHLAFFVLDVVGELDLGAFLRAHREDGRGGAVYDPATMLGVLVYAYCTGERSTRRIERRLVEDVAYRVLAANQRPDHATLARFRRRHREAVEGLFGQVLALCVKAGIVDAGLVAIDGTKIGADASFFANRRAESLAKEILDEAEAVDAAEDEQFGDRRGDELPEEWAGGRERKARIRAALQELKSQSARDYDSRVAEREAKEAATGKKLTGPKPKEQKSRLATERRANTTDPHSRIIAGGHFGALQGYNAQAAATGDQIVVAAKVTATTNDQPHFVPLATAATANLTAAGHAGGIGTIVADAGYWTAANATADLGADVLIATRRSPWRKAKRPDDDKLAVLARVNRGELGQREAARMLGVSHTWVRDMTKRYFGTEGELITRSAEPEPEEWLPVIERVAAGEISKRAAADALTVSAGRINSMLAHVRGETRDPSMVRADMDAKLEKPENAELYKKRSQTIEPVFGNIKANLGYRRFSLRSLQSVNSEWHLICTVHNLLKLRQARLA
jgi:transposase